MSKCRDFIRTAAVAGMAVAPLAFGSASAADKKGKKASPPEFEKKKIDPKLL